MVTYQNLGRYGRFGNQLFQIAGTIGLAKRFGLEYGFPAWVNWDAFDRFDTDENINVFEFFENELPRSEGTFKELFIPWGYHEVVLTDGVSISGHLQSERYFEHCKDLIQYYFKMKEEPEELEYTAIHIRRGDYGGDYHPALGMEYYGEAMKLIGGPYLLFSDDVDEAQRMIDCEAFVGDTYESFKVMKKCKNHIIANSTYSWWAAWLAGGRVVAPKRWFGPAAQLETKDIYARDWMVI